jgi:hypothetical protein
MKTIFTLLTFLFMSVAVLAADARPKSMLTIKSSDYGDIRVVLDGRRFEPGDNSLMIRQLESGRHQIRIYRQKNNGRFSIFGRSYEMVYNSSLLIRPRTQVRIMIDRFGRTTVDERIVRDQYQDRRDDRDFNGRDNRDREFNDRDNRDREFDGRDNRDGNDNGWDDKDSYDFDHGGKLGDYDNNYGYSQSMSDRDFSQLLQSIDKEWMESNKMKSATQVVKNNSLTSAQVRQLVMLFSFESNKLELAKQAYQNTVDKKNYLIINDAFSFSSSRDELARYTRNFR